MHYKKTFILIGLIAFSLFLIDGQVVKAEGNVRGKIGNLSEFATFFAKDLQSV